MKIKMLRKALGSRNGIKTEIFLDGQEYNLEGDLLKVFLKGKICVEIKGKKYENKNVKTGKNKSK